MSDNSKPLFSRPVLALVMLLCTLAIWMLTLTAPSADLPTPEIENWQTQSGVPVVWLKQKEWDKGDKLEIRFVFHTTNAEKSLNQATFAMLMSDSLPLSTATINQRLAPLAASVSSDTKHDQATLGLTVSNQSQYLMPTLTRVATWLQQPEFKQRTFERWQRQSDNSSILQKSIEDQLFTNKNLDTKHASITLNKVIEHHQSLLSSLSTIYIFGGLPEQAKPAIDAMLNAVSQHSITKEQPDEPTENQLSTRHISSNLANNTTLDTNQTPPSILWQSRSAVALSPLTSVQDWMTLQIWGSDLVSTLNKQTHIDFTQLALTLPSKQPWAGWNIQYATHLVPQETEQEEKLTAESFVFADNLPSIKDKKRFETLFDTLVEQLEQQALSPTWWSYIATQVTQENSPLSLEDFAKSYKEAVDTFSLESYQTALNRLLLPSSYQEFQVYQ